MRRLLIIIGLTFGLVGVIRAQRLTIPEFRELAHACVPAANERELLSLARTESNLNPWALSVNRPAALARRMGYSSGRIYLKHQPKSKAEAIRWARELEASGVSLSVGMLQVNLERERYCVEEALDPCRNVKLGWAIFLAAYRTQVRVFGDGQRALLAAFGDYNAGSALDGFRNGYVWTILKNSY
jgi:type IV secretion system protein VirB1